MNFDPSLLVLGGSASIFYTLRQYPVKVYNKIRQELIYTVTIYQYDELFDLFEKWLSDHYTTKYRDVEATIGGVQYYGPREDDLPLVLSYKQEENSFIVKHNNKKLIISKTKEKMDKAQNLKDLHFRKYIIRGIKAKAEIDSLLKMVIKYSEEKKNNNIVKVYSNDAYGNWYAPVKRMVKPLDKVILNPIVKATIIKDINDFNEAENWYIETSIAYKRGYCFYGPPGTGKTTLALSIANFTKKNIYCLNLNSIEDETKVPYMFNNLPSNSILLLEDIDKVFVGRDNVNERCKVSFSSLLNCLDGAFSKHGLITIITTNHIEKLDPALLRTGRIDMKIEVPRPEKEEVEQYISIFYGVPLRVYNYKYGMTMSDIQEICINNKTDFSTAIKTIHDKALQREDSGGEIRG
jgi:chaperone BCS1